MKLIVTFLNLAIALKTRQIIYFKGYMIYLLTAIELKAGGSSRVHICTLTVHRTTHSTQTILRKTQTIHRTTQYMEKHNRHK